MLGKGREKEISPGCMSRWCGEGEVGRMYVWAEPGTGQENNLINDHI